MSARDNREEERLDQALAWRYALDAEDADWAGYTAWLEADPANRAAYDSIALTERIVADHAGTLVALVLEKAEDPPVIRRFNRRRGAALAAAALAIAVSLPIALRSPPDAVYATALKEQRRVSLAGGITVDLAPATKLVAKEGDPNRLELAAGEAYFEVAHDPARKLAIKVRDFSVTDIGTRFAVNLNRHSLLVSVADGHVTVSRDGSSAPATVTAGHQLLARSEESFVSISDVAPTSVGSWRSGRLIYSNAPLSVVAADISRYAGREVVADPSLADRRFSGVLVIGDGSKLLPTLAEVMGISSRMDGDRVRIVPAPSR